MASCIGKDCILVRVVVGKMDGRLHDELNRSELGKKKVRSESEVGCVVRAAAGHHCD